MPGPLRDLLLHVVDDEADVIHHRALAAAVPGRIPERQVDAHAREQQRLRIARDRLPAHSDEDFLVGLRVFRREVPMTHGDAHLVEWGVLGVGGTGRQCRCNKEPSDCCPHECLPYVVLASFGGTPSILAYVRKLVRSAGVRWPTLPHRPRSSLRAATPPTAWPEREVHHVGCIEASRTLPRPGKGGAAASPRLAPQPIFEIAICGWRSITARWLRPRTLRTPPSPPGTPQAINGPILIKCPRQ